MFWYMAFSFLCVCVSFVECTQEGVAEIVNSDSYQYQACVRSLALHPELQGQFQKIMSWIAEGRKAPQTFEIEAPILVKRLEKELSPKEAASVVAFVQGAYKKAKYRRWRKNALIGTGVVGAGVGVGYGVHRYLKKGDEPRARQASSQVESGNVDINKGAIHAISLGTSSPDTVVKVSARQSSELEKEAKRAKRKKKANGPSKKRRRYDIPQALPIALTEEGSLMGLSSGLTTPPTAVDLSEAEVGQGAVVLPVELIDAPVAAPEVLREAQEGEEIATASAQSSELEKETKRTKRKKKANDPSKKRRRYDIPQVLPIALTEEESLMGLSSGLTTPPVAVGLSEAEVGQGAVVLPVEEHSFKADAESHGNKAANLTKLHEFCKKHSPYIKEKTGYELRVPPFVAISSEAVKGFLRKVVGVDLDLLWSEWVMSADSNQKKLSAAREIRVQLKQKCNENSAAIVELANFEELFGQEGRLVDIFLSDDRTQKNKIMVRSTGREDTATLANAGGNTSVPNVVTSFSEVFGAMKKVIFSYLSEKSLTQRLDAGDDIGAVPFVPVMMQVMVGEDMSVSEKERFIPRCGVMYTEEQEGGCFYAAGKKHFSGITLIQAAYGHNELVVNSLGKVDTFLVDKNYTVRQVIRNKPFRLVPGESKKLVKQRNKDNSAQKPALPQAAVKALKMLAERLDQRALRSRNNDEKAPQDVEFVIAHENDQNILYLVQVRPLVAKRYERVPSYVPAAVVDGATKVFGEVVGVAGGAVRTVHREAEALTATTLYSALNSELPNRGEGAKDQIEAVFVEEVAAETSHEANSMALLKKPVICLGSNYATVLDWLKDSAHDVVFDPQQSCVLLWDKSSGAAPQVPGWCAYPLARFLSVPEVEGEGVAEVIARADNDFKAQKFVGYKELRAQLAVLKNGAPAAMAEAVGAIWGYAQRLEGVIARKFGNEELRPKGGAIRGSYSERLRSLRYYIAQALRQCLSKESAGCAVDDPRYPALRLYPIHFLELLLFQQISDEFCLYADSITMVQKAFVKEFKMAKQLQNEAGGVANISEAKALLSLFESQAFRDETKEKWRMFIRTNFSGRIVEGSAQDIFLRNLRLLKDLDVAHLWLNTSFATNQDLELLNAEIAQSSGFIGELKEKKEELESIEISAFADPRTFWSAWGNFKVVVDYFLGEHFRVFFASEGGVLSKLIAVHTMSKLVDLFDQAIKAVTGLSGFEVLENKAREEDSSFFDASGVSLLDENAAKAQISEKKDKTFVFYFLLVYYKNLLKSWYSLMKSQGIILCDFSQDGGFGNYPLDKVINEWLGSCLKNISYVHPLRQLSSEEFDVNKIMIGQRVRFDPDAWFMPKTYEAYFTFVHQALLVIIGRFMLDLCPLERLPFFYTNFDKLLRAGVNPEAASVAKMIGVACSGAGICEVLYAIVLFAHGARLRVRSTEGMHTCSVDFRIIGPEGLSRSVDHNDRWKKSLDYIRYKKEQVFGGERMQYSADRDGINVQWQECGFDKASDIVLCVKTLCSLSFALMSHAFQFLGQAPLEFLREIRGFCKASGESGSQLLSILWFNIRSFVPDESFFYLLEADFALLDWNYSLSKTQAFMANLCATSEGKNQLQRIIYTNDLSESLVLCMIKSITRRQGDICDIIFDQAQAEAYSEKIMEYYAAALNLCKKRKTFDADQTYLFFLRRAMPLPELKTSVNRSIESLFEKLILCLPSVEETAKKMRDEALAVVADWDKLG